MWWGIGLGIFFYLILAFTVGMITLTKGHWMLFLVGIFFPLFWIIGALMRPTARAEAA